MFLELGYFIYFSLIGWGCGKGNINFPYFASTLQSSFSFSSNKWKFNLIIIKHGHLIHYCLLPISYKLIKWRARSCVCLFSGNAFTCQEQVVQKSWRLFWAKLTWTLESCAIKAILKATFSSECMLLVSDVFSQIYCINLKRS